MSGGISVSLHESLLAKVLNKRLIRGPCEV